MRLVAILVSALAIGCGSRTEAVLQELTPVDLLSLMCPCTFNESIPDATEGSYGFGPEVLVLDINGDPATARVNLGAGNIRLQSEDFSLHDCESEDVWSSTWRSDEVSLHVELVSSGPGAEACWFAGTAATTVGSRRSVKPIKGACGC